MADNTTDCRPHPDGDHDSQDSNPVVKWLDIAVEEIARGDNEQNLARVLRYRLCRSHEVLNQIVTQHPMPYLKKLLCRLWADDDMPGKTDALTRQAVLISLLPYLDLEHRDEYYQANFWKEMTVLPDASQTASRWEAKSHSLFQAISFEQHVSQAVTPGSESLTIEDFERWHDSLFDRLSEKLKEKPEIERFYLEILEHLADGSLAKCSLTQALTRANCYSPPPVLSKIHEPLRVMFIRQGRNLPKILGCLEVLKQRFRRRADAAPYWKWQLDERTDLLDDALTMSPLRLAESLSFKVREAFKALTPWSSAYGPRGLYELHGAWNRCSQDVEDCLTIDSSLLGPLLQTASILKEKRNFYSLFAILHGVKAADPRYTELQSFLALVDPNLGYKSYLEQCRQVGDLPFLKPYLRALQESHQSFIRRIGPFDE